MESTPSNNDDENNNHDNDNSNVVGSSSTSAVIVPHEEFAEDLELRLGRANGNIFHRKAGIDGVHDGQIMVRLKKKRYIIIDYSIVPTPSDLQEAAICPNVTCPDGAGKNKCVNSTCNKVGVPVLLYDSEPTETASLYIRSGLCFTCQRALNEKRRTQRKRKCDSIPTLTTMTKGGGGIKKIKINGTGEIIQLPTGAMIINGGQTLGIDTKNYTTNNTHELEIDIQTSLQNAKFEIQHLFEQQQQNSTSAVVAYAAQAAVAAAVTTSNPDLAVAAAITNAAVDAASTDLLQDTTATGQTPLAPSPPEEERNISSSSLLPCNNNDNIHTLYEKAFTSLSKSLYLLSHWKATWDLANQPPTTTTNGKKRKNSSSPSLVAAGAAAATISPEVATGTTMEGHNTIIPLLLAASNEGNQRDIIGDDSVVRKEINITNNEFTTTATDVVATTTVTDVVLGSTADMLLTKTTTGADELSPSMEHQNATTVAEIQSVEV